MSNTSESRAAAPVLSVVVPFHNEEETVDLFFERLEAVLSRLTPSYEIVCVDDGSQDGTLEALMRHQRRNGRIVIVELSRNFGKDAAISAGLDHARGRAIVFIDSDLQDPPELIEPMFAKWLQGHEVVYARRRERRSDGLVKRFTAWAFYRVYNAIAEVPIPLDTGDFRLIDRKVADVLRQLPERTRFMKGLFAWVGFRQASVEYDRPERAAGRTKWNLWKLWNFALDGLTSASTVPLRVWSYVGLLIAAFSFLYALYIIGKTLVLGVDVPGYASLMTVVLFLGGLNIIATGILGEYLGRVHRETLQRPLYIVREVKAASHGRGDREETASPPACDGVSSSARGAADTDGEAAGKAVA